jgi:hypothetical protein
MKRLNKTAIGMMLGMFGAANVRAGEADSSATASGGWFSPTGTAAATANYAGDAAGRGVAQTQTRTTDKFNLARGWAVGVDRDGLDFSFSHAIAGRLGLGYAGTFNLSIGRDGSVSGSYGGALANGGIGRTVEAGGATRSAWNGSTSTATANGNTLHGGTVKAKTESYNRPGFLFRGR